MRWNLLLGLFLILGTGSGFSQVGKVNQAGTEREQAIVQLEERINRLLLNLKKDIPSKYKKVWTYNLLDYDFEDLMVSNVELYNQILSVQEDYRRGRAAIEKKYPDVEMEALNEKRKVDLESLYKNLKKDIQKGVGPRIRQRFAEEMKPENFMRIKFEEIPYFVKQQRQLQAVRNIQKKYGTEFEKIEGDFQKAKEELVTRRMQEARERVSSFEQELARREKEGYEEEKEDGFLENFWIGIKTGVNYSTGSNSKSAEPAPGIGIISEYTVFKILPIAFEASLEFNINYIQKPVALDEGQINTDYINIPIFAKGKWPVHIPLGFGDFTPFIGIGIDPYIRLSSNFHFDQTNEDYIFDTQGFNVGFVWNLGGELNILGIGTATLEFRMSLGASSGIPAYMVPTGNITGGSDVFVPEQRQNGYMIFLGWKMPLSTIFFMF